MTLRQRIPRLLAGKEMTSAEVAQAAGVTPSGAMKVLRSMEDLGILRATPRNTGRGGVELVYSLTPPNVPLLQQVWRGVSAAL